MSQEEIQQKLIDLRNEIDWVGEYDLTDIETMALLDENWRFLMKISKKNAEKIGVDRGLYV